MVMEIEVKSENSKRSGKWEQSQGIQNGLVKQRKNQGIQNRHGKRKKS